MSQKAPFRPRNIHVVLFGLVFILLIPALALAQSDLSRKIIYMPNYRPIPGDVYSVSIDFGLNSPTATSGSSITSYSIILQEDRTIELPFIGTLNVGNMTFAQLRKKVLEEIKRAVPVQYVSFSLEAPAVFDVFVYGTVTKPGQHQMTSLNRLTDVLEAAGETTGSSARRIELKRNGKTLTYDLTKYYVAGDENANPYLLPGDEVFVPRVKDSVTLSGAVAKTGTYEILPGDTLGTILKLAGGLLPTALSDQITLQRLDSQNRYLEQPVDPASMDSIALQNGDRISIPSSVSSADRITVEGALYGTPVSSTSAQKVPSEPIRFDIPYRPGITLLDVLDMMGGPTPFAETDKSYIIRTTTGQRMPVPDLEQIWKSRSPERNITLQRGDYLVVPMTRLSVTVVGEVNSPQTAITYVSGYNVGDYLQAAGGIDPNTGDSNAIYFVSSVGKETKVGLSTNVPPGTTIYVAKNTFTNMQTFFRNVFIVTGWVTSIIGVSITVMNFVNQVK